MKLFFISLCIIILSIPFNSFAKDTPGECSFKRFDIKRSIYVQTLEPYFRYNFEASSWQECYLIAREFIVPSKEELDDYYNDTNHESSDFFIFWEYGYFNSMELLQGMIDCSSSPVPHLGDQRQDNS
ncbi:MAG: hypothetical protein ABIA04_11795 [Pseudomonadota bacterium]